MAPLLAGPWTRCPALAGELERRLADPELRRRQREEQFAALDRMGRGGPDPSEAAAEAVLRVLVGRRSRMTAGPGPG